MSKRHEAKDINASNDTVHIRDVPAKYSQNMVTGKTLLPEVRGEWRTVTLGEIAKTYSGLTGKKGADFGNGGARYVSFLDVLENVSLGSRQFDRVRIRDSESQNRVAKNDVLFNATSETPEDLGVGSRVDIAEDDLYLNSFCFGIRIFNESHCDPLFLAYYSRSNLGRRNMYALAQGATRYNLSKRRFLSLRLSLPPLPEQRAIAAVLTDVGELIGSLEALISKKRAIKQAAMQQLLTGRTRLPGFVGEWKVVQLGVFVRIRNRKISPVDVRGETPCVELDHIGQGDGRLVSHGIAGRTSSIKHRFEPHDILFGRLRPYLRKWWYADRMGVCSTEIWPLVVDRGRAESGFVYALVQTDRFLNAAEASYGTHMPRADWNIVAGVEFQLPPVSEQRAIATILSDMDAEIAALERRLDKTRAIKQGMGQKLLSGSIRLPVQDDSTEVDAHGT